MYRNFLKRMIDMVLTIFALAIISPIFIIISLVLFFNNNGKPFFFQERPGKNGKIFRIIKFKSMNDKKDSNGNLLPDSKRMTKTGIFIRKTSLDEIPQLLNVLKGEMSIIGPRPLLKQYLPYYTDREKIRHKVRPGITGLAQVSGRNNLDWRTRLELDVQYVENLNLSLDVKVFLKTIKKVLTKEDVVVVLDPEINIPLDIHRKNSLK